MKNKDEPNFWLHSGDDLGKFLLSPLLPFVSEMNSGATVGRLLVSRHVKDLRFIVGVSLLFVIVLLFLAGFASIEEQFLTPMSKSGATLDYSHLWMEAGKQFGGWSATVLAVFGAIVAWSYQTGSARLGVVDLFACEISTLCRVATITGTVQRFIERFQAGPPAPVGVGNNGPHNTSEFSSQEDYFPIFGSNSQQLEALEARVVINITSFYTYMKAMRDMLRSLYSISPRASDFQDLPDAVPAHGSWREAARNVIYMLFLSLESARQSITDLVEFEPEVAEHVITILLSELGAYGFLLEQFSKEKDMRFRRIQLRAKIYGAIVPKLISTVEAAHTQSDEDGRLSWDRAYQLLPDLQQRFNEVGLSAARD
jgi:hypothetical protein